MRLGFVIPRYKNGIIGGAETLVSQLAEKLAARGDEVSIITTTALDHRTWEDYFPEGKSVENGMSIFRFKVEKRNLEAWVPLQIRLAHGEKLSLEEELIWMSESVNSRKLYQFLEDEVSNFDAFIFAPYLFGVTFFGSVAVKEKAILLPCLHDETYAYTNVVASMFRQVRGVLYNASPERELAQRLYGRRFLGGVVGLGFNESPFEILPHYFQEKFPYIVYVGRKETGKNAHLLLDYFAKIKECSKKLFDLKLVIVGGGSFSDLERPWAATREDVIDLPPVTEEEKSQILQHAMCLAQPSRNESFSIVLMESWLQKTPCLVHARCEVTKDHVVKSGGGLFFDSPDELRVIIEMLHQESDLRNTLGEAGYQYVKKVFCWDAVLDRFDNAIHSILG